MYDFEECNETLNINQHLIDWIFMVVASFTVLSIGFLVDKRLVSKLRRQYQIRHIVHRPDIVT